MNVKIHRSYIIVMIIFISAAAILPIFLCIEYFAKIYLEEITFPLLIYLIGFLAVYLNISYEIRLLSTLYHRYKIAIKDPRIASNSIQQITAIALSKITFSDVLNIRKLKRNEKRKIKNLGDDNTLQTFELVNNANIGIIVYNSGKIHAYAVMILLAENNLLILNDAFTQVKEGQKKRINQEFELWANNTGIKFDYLKLEDERVYTDDKLG